VGGLWREQTRVLHGLAVIGEGGEDSVSVVVFHWVGVRRVPITNEDRSELVHKGPPLPLLLDDKCSASTSVHEIITRPVRRSDDDELLGDHELVVCPSLAADHRLGTA